VDTFVRSTFPPLVYDAFNALPRIVMKADMFRYLVLLAYGGVYSDTDTNCLKPISEWAVGQDATMIVGIEADISKAILPNPEKPWHHYWMRRLQLEQWTIAAEAGHPALVSIVWRIIQKSRSWTRTEMEYQRAAVWQLEEGSNANEADSVHSQNRPPTHADMFSSLSDVDYIENWTGPGIWTDAVLHYLDVVYDISWKNLVGLRHAANFGKSEIHMLRNGVLMEQEVIDIVVLPLVGFSPGHPQQALSMSVDHPLACIYHEFLGTWKEENKDKYIDID
jgi:hypothetical protein